MHVPDLVSVQETRRLVIAVWQHIVFDEYLPLFLGKEAATKYQLSSYNSTYNSSIDPTVATEVSTAAFRVGHSQIPELFTFTDKTFAASEKHELKNVSSLYVKCVGSGRESVLGCYTWQQVQAGGQQKKLVQTRVLRCTFKSSCIPCAIDVYNCHELTSVHRDLFIADV